MGTQVGSIIDDALQGMSDLASVLPGHIAGLGSIGDLVSRLEAAVSALERLVETIDPALLEPHTTAPAAPSSAEVAPPVPDANQTAAEAQTVAPVVGVPHTATPVIVPDELGRPA